MTRFILLAALLPLAACGYSTEEYALNRSALAPGVGVVGGPVKDINPVSGETVGNGVGSGMPSRSLVNPAHDRYDPFRPFRR